MIYGGQSPHPLLSLFIYLRLHKDISFVSVNVKNPEIKNRYLVYLILVELVWREILNSPFAFKIELKRPKLHANLVLLS
jgi:hypothetical protein